MEKSAKEKSKKKDVKVAKHSVEKVKKEKVKKEKVQVKEKKDGFFKKLRKEMSQVKWPSFKELMKYTLATIVLVVVFALFFQLIDLISSYVKGLF